MMWKYIKRYLHFAVIAACFMISEVLMDLLQPGIMSQIVDEGVLGLHNGGLGDLHVIWQMGFLMIGLVLFGGLCGSLNNVFVHLSGQNIGNEMRKDCFRKIMTFSFPQIDSFGTGSLVTRVTNDIIQVQNFVSQFIRGMIRTSLLMFGSMFFMYRLNRTFGLIVLCAFPFIVGCLCFCLVKVNPLFTKLQAQLDRINSIMQEDVSGIRMIKACVREIYEKLRFGKANEELIGTQLQVLVIFAFMNPVINGLMYIVVTVILLAGSYEVSAGQTTPGNIMAAITYTTQLLNGILMLVMLFQNISRGLVSWKRVKEILDTKPELKNGTFDGKTEKKGEIEFRNVSFSYPGTDRKVLENINLSIHRGEIIAIMGATGCGKTTLVNLIPRFYDVTEGAVFVDGVDVREYEQKDLRERIAVVLQKSELFSDTIGNNIAWGAPKSNVKEVKSAAMTAQADDFINETHEEYETMIAERGMSLSGGQKQRLSIARAIVKNGEILIFDDSTSALDLKTEANLYSALQKAQPESTKIIVAQRIASVRRADRIVVLDSGKIVAVGTHEELLRSCLVYQDIYRSQMGKENCIGNIGFVIIAAFGGYFSVASMTEITFHNVQFSYIPEQPVIRDFNLSVPAGEKIALVGATGSGKTTIANLLMRFYDIDSGKILINGQDIKYISRDSLRKNVAIVLQDTVLFEGTIRDNLKYGNENATEEQLEQAVERSSCGDMLHMLPQGYDTLLKASGENISQGQRQLLAIARAFVADPRILILDEATSNVDTRTEKAIQDAMQFIMKDRTSIIIAHRLSTIQDADRIVVMDHGKIVETGSHEELLLQKGKYYELYMTQYAGFAT